MMISFHTKLFDTTDAIADNGFRGDDLARWLELRLTGWNSSVIAEDWGWAILAEKGEFKYIFGVYDHDTVDLNEHGPRWVVRLFNKRDGTKRFQKLFRNIPPVAHEEVVKEIIEILQRSGAIADIKTEPL